MSFIWGPLLNAGGALANPQLFLISVTDSGSGSDAVARPLTKVPITDTGAGAEVIAIRKKLAALADFGFGFESGGTNAIDEIDNITIPLGMSLMVIDAWGTGGTGMTNGGGGGGGGAWGRRTIPVMPGEEYYMSWGGVEGDPTEVYLVASGSDILIMSVPCGVSPSDDQGGDPGFTADCVNCDSSYRGGYGADAVPGDRGGGGGASGSPAGPGGNAIGQTGGTAPSGGGDGGDGGDASAGGESGTTPGGGSGGAGDGFMSPAGGGEAQARFTGTQTIGVIVVNKGSTPKSVTDTGVGTDATPTIEVEFLITDTATGVETEAIRKKLAALTDTGVGVDDVTKTEPATPKDIADSGAGSDIIALIKAALGITDTGAGADDIGIKVPKSETDTGAGVDATPGIHVSVVLGDTAHGIETKAGGTWYSCAVFVKVSGAWKTT